MQGGGRQPGGGGCPAVHLHPVTRPNSNTNRGGTERLLLAPDLDRDLGVAPQRLAVEPGGFLQCLLDTVEGARLAHPTGQVGDMVVWQPDWAPQIHEITLFHASTTVGFV